MASRRVRPAGAAALVSVALAVSACAGTAGPGSGQPEVAARTAPDVSSAGAQETGAQQTGAQETGAQETGVRATDVATPATAAAVADAFGDDGTVAVALAPVQPADGAEAAGSCADGSVPVARAGADRPVATASLVKLYIAAELLHRERAGEIELSDRDRTRMEAMLVRSDDGAASQLWVAYGGGQLVTDMAARYGLTGTAPPAQDPGQWGQTTTTAADLACFLALLPSMAGEEDARTVLGWLRMTAPVAADGFDQRFGLFGIGDAAVKQGWSCCLDGIRLLHSAGVADGVAVVLLTESAPQADYPEVAARLDAATAVVDDATG